MLLGIFAFIAHFESFSHVPYFDRAQYTYGYGTRSKSAHKVVNEAAAKKEALHAIRTHFDLVCHLPHLNQQQKTALTSFSYNVGQGAFVHSRLYHLVYENHKCAAKEEFAKWIYQSGHKLVGLVKRRQAEKTLFSHGLRC